jgi:hypothetical protein
MASIKNIVIVAISQVGVIVFGVLGAGIFHKECSLSGMHMPLPVYLLYSYGFMGFFVPLAWGAGAVVFQLRASVSDDIRTLMFGFGVLVLVALAIFCLYADISPWFNGIWDLSGNGDDSGQ